METLFIILLFIVIFIWVSKREKSNAVSKNIMLDIENTKTEKTEAEILKEWHENPSNWKWGIFYYNKNDKRIFSRKRIRWMGWTLNFANPKSIWFIIVIIFLFIVIREQVISPYNHFATNKPDSKSIIGNYRIDKSKADNVPTSGIKRVRLSINSDSTFAAINFPTFDGFGRFSNFCNATGKWKIGSNESFNAWVIMLYSDTLFNPQTNNIKGGFNEGEFFIYNNEPPYQIYYIEGDPDLWSGTLFIKE